MDLNYILTPLFIDERVESRRRDAGALQRGTGSPIVAIIGRSATALARAANRVAGWADGNSDVRPGASRAAF